MPTYMRGRSPIQVPLHRVMDVLRTIDKLGHTQNFHEAAQAAGAAVRIHPKTVNFIKDYLANNNLTHDPVAKEIVGSGGGEDSPPAGCPYHQPG